MGGGQEHEVGEECAKFGPVRQCSVFEYEVSWTDDGYGDGDDDDDDDDDDGGDDDDDDGYDDGDDDGGGGEDDGYDERRT